MRAKLRNLALLFVLLLLLVLFLFLTLPGIVYDAFVIFVVVTFFIHLLGAK